jgi:hypothetical protein
MSRFGLGFIGAGGVPGNDAFTKILLHMDGSNGGTSFPDVNVGGSAHTWTPTNATTSTAAAKFGPSSMLGVAGYISTPAHADFNIGTNDACFDFWLNNDGSSAGYGIAGQIDSGGTLGGTAFVMQKNASGFITVSMVNAAVSATTTMTGTTNLNGSSNWTHVAWSKAGTTFRLFLSGVQEATTTFASINSGSTPFHIGRAGNLGTPLSGRLDEVRLSIGDPRFIANFTPPVAQYI